jgi:hypothetical protein
MWRPILIVGYLIIIIYVIIRNEGIKYGTRVSVLPQYHQIYNADKVYANLISGSDNSITVFMRV